MEVTMSRPNKDRTDYRDTTDQSPGILADWEIRKFVKIEPFSEGEKRPGKISYGVTSYGYDLRVGYKFKVFTNVYGATIDPKNFDPDSFVDVDVEPFLHEWHGPGINKMAGQWVCARCMATCYDTAAFMNPCSPVPDHINIPPNSFALAESLETLTIPRDILCVCLGKSTYARCGIIVNVTPLEPEWTGKVTIEISNTAPLPAKIYAGEGILQVLFFRASSECEVSYADKKGRYQDQKGLTLPFVEGAK
jgi:dCTP deaminase